MLAQRHICADMILYVLYLVLVLFSFILAFRASSWADVILKIDGIEGLGSVETEFLAGGDGSNSIWSKVGMGGDLAPRMVRSWNGSTLRGKPRALSA